MKSIKTPSFPIHNSSSHLATSVIAAFIQLQDEALEAKKKYLCVTVTNQNWR